MPSLLQHNASLRTHRQVLVGGPARASSDNPRLWPVLAAFRHAVFRGDLHGSVQVVSRVFGSYVAIPGRGPGGAWLSWSLSRWDGPGLSVGTGFPRPGRPGGRESGGSRGGSLQSLIRLAEDFRRASAEPFSCGSVASVDDRCPGTEDEVRKDGCLDAPRLPQHPWIWSEIGGQLTAAATALDSQAVRYATLPCRTGHRCRGPAR